mmetsp:Transcript_45354/g.126158  ORF Transcript_45354/g.126158 Transcript_45354/m.126158 type:complete len:226 (-) Transcript_45354:3884-4561(-)
MHLSSNREHSNSPSIGHLRCPSLLSSCGTTCKDAGVRAPHFKTPQWPTCPAGNIQRSSGEAGSLHVSALWTCNLEPSTCIAKAEQSPGCSVALHISCLCVVPELVVISKAAWRPVVVREVWRETCVLIVQRRSGLLACLCILHPRGASSSHLPLVRRRLRCRLWLRFRLCLRLLLAKADQLPVGCFVALHISCLPVVPELVVNSETARRPVLVREVGLEPFDMIL